MNKILQMLSVIVLAGMFTGCMGTRVEVPPAHVGKISAKAGLQEDTIQPSKLRINRGRVAFQIHDDLLLAETSDLKVEEADIDVLLTADQVYVEVEYRGVVHHENTLEAINELFVKVRPDSILDGVPVITTKSTYETYGKIAVRDVVRYVIAGYSIEELMSSRAEIGEKILQEVRGKVKDTPLNVVSGSLAKIKLPDVIVSSLESNKKREIEILEAENDMMVKLKEKESEFKVAQKEQEVDLLEAETQVLVNTKLAEGANPAYIQLQMLKIWTKIAESDNRIIITTPEMISDASMMIPTLNDAMSDQGNGSKEKKILKDSSYTPVDTLDLSEVN